MDNQDKASLMGGAAAGIIVWTLLVIANFKLAPPPQKPTPAPVAHAWDCMEVRLTKVDDKHYRQHSRNTCNQPLDTVVVLVKFFDEHRNRIGVSGFGAQYVAAGEHLDKVFSVPLDVEGFASVGVRAIKEDWRDLP